MSKLYDLVKLRNSFVREMDKLSLAVDIKGKVELLDSLIIQNDSDRVVLLEKFKDNYTQSFIENQMIVANSNRLLETLNQEIEEIVTELFFTDSYRENFREELISQAPYPSAELESYIVSKVTEYSDWHYPTLQINPRFVKWIKPMVAGDPLYLTHTDINLVKELIKEYPEQYQNRLRLYEIADRNFSTLPQGQFGFVFCWDNFNHLSLDKVETYIKEVWKLLRPGGSFIFNYNNCDLEGPAYRAECYASSYASASRLTKLFNEIGYEITSMNDFETDDAFNTHISWVDIKKPGKLKTIKAAQAMAQIFEK